MFTGTIQVFGSKISINKIQSMDSHSKIEVAGEGDYDAELMAELEREVARNNEAVRLVKEKELQAVAARDR